MATAFEKHTAEVPQVPDAGKIEAVERPAASGEKISGNPEEVSGEAREKATALIRTALDRLEAVAPKLGERIAQAREQIEQGPEAPPLQEQMALILQLGRLAYEKAEGDDRKKVWGAYQACIDDFRKGYANLPPLRDAGRFGFDAGEVMNDINNVTKEAAGKNAWSLLRQFDEEKRMLKQGLKGVPGINVLVGFAAGAEELGSGLITLGKEAYKAAIGIGISPEEQAKAQEVMAAVGKSLMNLDELAAAVLRTNEYAESFKQGQGETTGYVIGKSMFDIASLLLGTAAAGKALQVATKVTTKTIAGQAFKKSVETGVRAVKEILKKPAAAEMSAAASAVGIAAETGLVEAAQVTGGALLKKTTGRIVHAAESGTEKAMHAAEKALHAAEGEHGAEEDTHG